MDINSLYDIQDSEIDVKFEDAIGEKFEFKTLYKLKDFLTAEKDYWKKTYENLEGLDNNQIYKSKNRNLVLNTNNMENATIHSILAAGLSFEDILHDFKVKLANANPNKNNDFELAINSINSSINSPRNSHWVCSQNNCCKRGFEISKDLGITAANSFFEAFVLERKFTNLSTMDGLKGAMLAYEFQMQDEHYLGNRIALEEESVNQLKKSIIEIKDNLYEDVLSEKSSFKKWRAEAETSINSRYDSQEKEFDGHFQTWSNKIKDLEKTYNEKLRLEPAATYWTNKAADYKRQGNLWAGILTAVIIGGISLFGILFYTWINAQSTAISIDSLQGVVLFITVLSIYAFAIKAVSKMVFSSYHLQRDAEEREQLTYLYLALTKDKDNFNVDARNIVLQALFSRADTGLISGDSSPTMPGLHEIINASSSK